MAENEINDEQMEEEENELIVLADEEGKEIEFKHIATLDYENEWYIYLHPIEDEDVEDDEMVIFHIQTDADGNDIFVLVEDEELIDKLYNEYLKEMDAQSEE